MGACAKRIKIIETAPGVTVKHARLVSLVKAMRGVVVPVAVGGGEVVRMAGDDVLPTPAAPKEIKAKGIKAHRSAEEPLMGGTGNRKHHREPGSDNHVPRQQDVFLTCGDPEGTLPCRCPFDRAHSTRSGGGGAHFASAAASSPSRRGGGGVRVRVESTARRYPACLLNGAGLSIDAQEDALFERQRVLASWGVAGYGVAQRDDDGYAGVVALDRFFAGRPRAMIRAMLGHKGMSAYVRGIGGAKERGGDADA